MASSLSSAMLIIVSFSVFVLAANAVRDMPNATYVPEQVLSRPHIKLGENDYFRVANLKGLLVKSSWEGGCFKESKGWYSHSLDHSIYWVYVQVAKGKTLTCYDSYIYKVGDVTLASDTMYTSIGTHSKSFLPTKDQALAINTNGIDVYMYEPPSTSNKESGQDGIKQVVETY
ncbi:uncharacterized protein LOC126685839 [Mercurialis annua]|uniref:uncharacterized protein LOC126685839 n=1 Tax=Mercurialis annua TaxID=3986 RepID=UPI00215E4380|nr:uncharacterized protein LOC126685839 [Mercurialis annua]